MDSDCETVVSWWRHQMETFSALLALCAWNSPVSGDFPTQRPVTRSFVSSDLHLIKRLSKHSRGWWFETLSHSLCRHCNDHRYYYCYHHNVQPIYYPSHHHCYNYIPYHFIGINIIIVIHWRNRDGTNICYGLGLRQFQTILHQLSIKMNEHPKL